MKASATERLLCIGGRLHGRYIDVFSDDETHVDLLTAETYYRHTGLSYTEKDVRSGMPLRTWAADAMIHEQVRNIPVSSSVPAAARAAQVRREIIGIALREWFETNGHLTETPVTFWSPFDGENHGSNR